MDENGKKAKKLKYVELHEDITLNGVRIAALTRLPVLTDSEMEKGSVEIDKNAIILGLAEAVRTDAEGEDLPFFKKILLADGSLVKRLTDQIASITSESGIEDVRRNFHVIQLLRRLQESEISFINESKALINMIQNELDDEDEVERMEDELFETLKEGLDHYPDSYSLLFHMADYHKNAGNFDLAEKYIAELGRTGHAGDANVMKLAEEIKDYAIKHERILYIYDLMNLNRIDEAISQSLDFLERDGKNWHVNFLIGWAYRIKEDYERAQKHLLESIRRGGGDFAENFNELSLAAWNLGQRELAANYVETASDLDPKSVTYACNAAMMRLELKEYEEAAAHLRAAHLLDKDDAPLRELIRRYEKETGEKFVRPRTVRADD